MKKLLILAVACFVASPAFAADLKWYGETGVQYNETKFDDSLAAKDGNGYDVSIEKTKAHLIRGRLGVTGGKDHVDYGFGLRTQAATAAKNNDWRAYNNGNGASGDLGLGIELMYFRYSNDYGFGDVSLTAGRQMNAFAYDKNSEQLFDTDVRFDGFGWNWKMGNFGLNAAQYILGYNSNGTIGASSGTTTAATDANHTGANSSWATLLGVQPTFNFRFTDDIESMFAVGYYWWNGTGTDTSFKNNLHGAQGATTGRVGGVAEVNPNQTFQVSNPKQIQFLMDTSLPYNLGLSFEFIRNKKYYYDEYTTFESGTTVNGASSKSREAKRSAWAVTLAYGKIQKAHDFKVSYNYGTKGLASTVNAYANDAFLADQKGHTLKADFAATDTLTVGAKYMTLKEVSKLDSTGLAPGTHTTTANGGAPAAQAGRSHSVKYWQLTAGVAF
jgi:hypothetical protein